MSDNYDPEATCTTCKYRGGMVCVQRNVSWCASCGTLVLKHGHAFHPDGLLHFTEKTFVPGAWEQLLGTLQDGKYEH